MNMKPFGFSDYINLQLNAFCVLSDSGTISEEAAILNFPAVSIRTSTERPEALDTGNLILGGIAINIIDAIKVVTSQDRNNREFIEPKDYTEINVSKKVVRILFSMTEMVNKKVWFKV